MTQSKLVAAFVLGASIFLLIGCSSAGVRPDASLDSKATVDHAGMAGRWRGAYHDYPNVILLDVELEPSGGTLAGQMQVEVLNSRGSAKKAAMPVTVNFNPVTRTVSIDPGLVVQRGGRVSANVRVPNMEGVYVPSMDAIGGTLGRRSRDSSPHFVLGRGKAGSEFVGKARDVADREGGLGRLAGLVGGPSDRKIEAWAGVLEREYPGMDPMRTEFGRLYTAARPLFSDEIMLEHLGETYDGMGGGGRAAMARKLSHRNEDLRRYSGLGRGFGVSGTYTDADIMVSVLAYRVMIAWRDGLEGAMESVEASEDALRSIDGFTMAANERLGSLLPSQRRDFRPVAEAARRRIIPAVLEARYAQLLGSTSPGAAGDMVQWLNADPRAASASRRVWYERGTRGATTGTSTPLLLTYASDADRARWRQGLDERLDAVLAERTAAWKDRLAGFDRSLAGLEASVGAYKRYRREFSFAWGHPRVRAALEPMAAERDAMLPALLPRLGSMYARANSMGAINQISKRYLDAPGDTAGRARSLASVRRFELNREAAHREAFWYFVAAVGANLAGDEAMRDAAWLDGVLVGALARAGRQLLLEQAAERLAYGRPAHEARRWKELMTSFLDGDYSDTTLDELEDVLHAGVASFVRDEMGGDGGAFAADAYLFMSRVDQRWREVNDR